jgi:hypothetical protein
MDAGNRMVTRPGEDIGPWPHVVIENRGDDPVVPALAIMSALGMSPQ